MALASGRPAVVKGLTRQTRGKQSARAPHGQPLHRNQWDIAIGQLWHIKILIATLTSSHSQLLFNIHCMWKLYYTPCRSGM